MRRQLLFILLICVVHIPAITQERPTTDPQKLLLLIEKNKPDTTYIGWLLELSNYYFLNRGEQKSGIDSSLLLANKAETISLKLNYPKGVGNSYIAISRALRKTQQEEKRKEYINKAIKIFTNDRLYTDLGFAYWELSGYYSVWPPQVTVKISLIEKAVASWHQAGNIKKEADGLKELADVRQINGDYVRALNDLNVALKLYQSINEPGLQGIYDLLGDVSCSLGNLNDAVRYGLLAIQMAEKVKDTTLQLCTIYNRLGITYYYLKDYNSAAMYYQKALAIAEKYESLNHIYHIAVNYGNSLIRMKKITESNHLLTSILKKYPGIDDAMMVHYKCTFLTNYTLLKQFLKARQYFDELASIAKAGKLDHEMQRSIYVASVRYLLASGQNEKARDYLKGEEKYLTEAGNLIQLSNNQLSWTDLDSAVGNYRLAFRHFRKYIALKDSIYSEAKTRYIEQLNVQFETTKKDRDILLKEKNIELLEQKGKIQLSELLQANQTRNWILAATVLLAVIIGLLINNARIRQRTNKKLQAQQKEIEKKNATLQKLVDEKEWLVKEIHHRVKNNFHIVQGLLGTQSGYLKSEEAINALADSRHRVQAMSLIHQKLYQSDSLSAINMADYIHELTNYLRDSFRSSQSIQFNLQVDPIELDLSHCIPLGLILNEAITNAIKYAFPENRNGKINVVFRRTMQNHLTLIISDNGVGLPGDFETENPVSMGMRLMRGLSDDIDAKFYLISHEGTEIKLEFILDSEVTNLHKSNKKELAGTV